MFLDFEDVFQDVYVILNDTLLVDFFKPGDAS